MGAKAGRNRIHLGGKDPDEADCAELQREAKPIMIASQVRNDRPVALIQMETARDVRVVDHIRKPAIPRTLSIAPEACRHSQISEVLRGKVATRKINDLRFAKDMCENLLFCNKICDGLERAA